MKLLYVGDPMCSWCYGFGKELSALCAMHPELPLEIITGGLRAGATDVLDDAGKQFRLPHWARVEQLSGLPFNREAFLARQGFVYDTEPICRAVVAGRIIAPQADHLALFRALQHAFYVDGRDTTDGRVLAEVAAGALNVSADDFHAVWRAQDTRDAAQADFMLARRLGIRSFPALLLDTGDGIVEVSGGYAQAAELSRTLEALVVSS